MWFWLITGIILGLGLFAAWLWDKRWNLDSDKVPEHGPDGISPHDTGGSF
jgi:hypothetical protein